MARVAGSRHLLPNEEPVVVVNQTKLACNACNEQVIITWREGELPSKTAESAAARWREAHQRHGGYREALPILGKSLDFDRAPPEGSTLFDRYPLNAPPPPPWFSAPPAPGSDLGDGGPASSYYDDIDP